MTLATYTATLLAAVRATPDTSLDAHAEALGASPQRLGIYRSFVRDHVSSRNLERIQHTRHVHGLGLLVIARGRFR